MWSDNDTIEDLIGFRVHAELIRDVVGDDSVLPVTIGVFGDWGSGKTSIMKMLQSDLAKNEQVAVVYFDAWLFEGYDDAKSALISSILKQLMGNKRFPAELKDKAIKLIKRVNWMRLMKMGWDNVALPAVLAYATGGATAVPAVVTGIKAVFGKAEDNPLNSENAEKLLREPEEDEITEVKDFRDKFGELLRDSQFKSLVVMIDDLDRCSPDRIVENLEAIVYFSTWTRRHLSSVLIRASFATASRCAITKHWMQLVPPRHSVRIPPSPRSNWCVITLKN